ncbi:glycosyl transferase family 2 [Parenemella sanctibonifatiensis]|uniref:Glycosyl transferase family 2 n=1 Tax=Parenemella sanctibonifatiensis TaxID=2016505 RepID=A0A255EAC5_9ACTN|nr:glycosyl transferase family 2 [Parenemella sanctibonifatiensis]
MRRLPIRSPKGRVATPTIWVRSARHASLPDVDPQNWPPVSVVMPVRNEEKHLVAAVQRIMDQAYPGEVEVIIALAPSKDRTAEVAAEIVRQHPQVRVVDNARGWTPVGLNLAIAEARHDILVRVDGHGELTDGYITLAVQVMAETGAANVGGVMDAQGRTPFEQTVAVAYTSRLGLGNSTFHLVRSPAGPSDSVYLGVFRRGPLAEVGGFDETMRRAQDWELNHRLRKAGHTVWFDPRLRVTYRPRSTMKALARQFYETGQWRREVVRRHPETATLRYLAPPVATAGVAVGSVVAPVGILGLLGRGPLARVRWLAVLATLAIAAPIGYAAIVTAGAALLRRELPWRVRWRLPAVLACMHLSWGAGFLRGLKR